MIDEKIYLDKVHGGWFGKCLGGCAGAPVEGVKKLIETDHYSKTFRLDLPNDDLDLQLLWLEVLQEKGFAITANDLALAWDEKCWYPFNEYGLFLKNFERHIAPPYSGVFNNPFFCESEGSPIRSEIWGMCFPNRPEIAAAYAGMDSSLDHSGESVWIEQYYAAIEAQAFTEKDILKLLTDNLKWLPTTSRAYGCVVLVLNEYIANKDNWQLARTKMLRQYVHSDFSNAVTNLGITVIALLFAKGDLDTVINIAYRCGFDADCTCATAGSIMGIILGYNAIDNKLKVLVKDSFVVGINVNRTNNSIAELSKETVELGMKAFAIKETFPVKPKGLSVAVEYVSLPAIGINDTAKMKIIIENNTTKPISDTLLLCCDNSDFWIWPQKVDVEVSPKEKRVISCNVSAKDNLKQIPPCVICNAQFNRAKTTFGLAGASVYKVYGPFFDAMQKEDKPNLPKPHPDGCNLPNLECMMNNEVFLEKDFAFDTEDSVLVNSYEDTIPLDENFAFRGQGCFYLEQTIHSPKEQDVWIVIGNSDSFKYILNNELIMEKDEIRLFTPYNNYDIVHLKKGENKVKLKLLKRTENLKFAISYAVYGGEHFNKTRWLTNLSTSI